jgi:hypothetical protein
VTPRVIRDLSTSQRLRRKNNAENLLVIGDKKLAERYIKYWLEHESHSETYAGREK